MTGLFVLFWFVGGGVALRYLVLFVGVMSCMYVLWDVIGTLLNSILVYGRILTCCSRRYHQEED